jgi:membrane fusion protein (multidrug efflux system)
MLSLPLSGLIALILPFISLACIAQNTENPERPLDVIVQPVAARSLHNTIQALANLHAYESVAITAKTTKILSKIYFDDGQRVNKGDLLVEMTSVEESALMDEARLTADEAKKQLARSQALSKTGALSQALLDVRTREYQTAQAHFVALQSRFKDSLISAPFSGILGLRELSPGALVAPGQTIAWLNDDSKMKLEFSVPAKYFRSLRLGLPVEAKSNDLSDTVYSGKIVSIDNQLAESTRSIKVRVMLDNINTVLPQGLLMTVKVLTDTRQALGVSEAALVPMGSNNFVFVARRDNNAKAAAWIAEKRQVYIGQRSKGWVEIVSGLQAGDKVVTHGLQKIHSGQALVLVAEQSNDPSKNLEPLSELLRPKTAEVK